MNVLFTSPALFGEEGVFGGGERYALGLARAVAAELGGATLYAAGSRDDQRAEGPLQIVTRRPRFLVRGQAHNPFPRALWSQLGGIDAVHCFQQHITLTSTALGLARVRGIPVFVTDLGGGGWDLSSYVDTSGWFTGMLHLSRFAQKIAGRDGDQRDAVLYGGADAQTRKRADAQTVLYVGRLYPHKGADVLVEAAQPDWDVVVVGRAYDERFFGDVKTLAKGKRVSFVQDASDARLDEEYARAAVVVCPSVGRDRYGGTTQVPELLGLVALEAAVRGIPVVASDIASLPEIVEHGRTGLLVPPGDATSLRQAIGQLLADPALRARMGDAARARATERFGWKAAATTAVTAYQRAIGP